MLAWPLVTEEASARGVGQEIVARRWEAGGVMLDKLTQGWGVLHGVQDASLASRESEASNRGVGIFFPVGAFLNNCICQNRESVLK